MMMVDEGFDLFGPGDDDVDDDGGDLSMDLDTFWHILGEDPEQPVQQSIPEELAVEYAAQGEPILDGAKCENLQLQNGNSLMASECGNQQSFSQIYSPSHTRGKHNSWFPLQPYHEACCSKIAEASEVDIPSCSTSSSFAVQDDGSHNLVMGTLDVSFGNCGVSSKNSLENLGSENNTSTSLNFSIMNADMSSQNATSTESIIHQSSDVNNEWNDHYPMEQFMDVYDELSADQSHQYIPNSFYSQVVPSHEEFMNKTNDEEDEFPTESASSSSKMMLNAEGGRRGGNVLEVVEYMGINGQNYSCDSGNYISPVSGNSSSNFDGRFMADKALPQPLTCVQSKSSRENQYVSAKNENSNGTCFPLGVIDEPVRSIKQPLHGILSSKSNQKLALHTFDKEDINLGPKGVCHGEDTFYGIASESYVGGYKHLSSNAKMQGLPFTKPSTSNKQLFGCIKGERDVKLIQPKGMSSDASKLSFESSSCRSILDNDPDICITEEFSHPARPNQSLMPVRSVVTSQRSTYDITLHHTEVGSSRFRENDERSIFQAALQDLSQPKSEASPPDGLLAVPLLRHQRIALSWMVNKETTGTNCSGGILADDQGLGKTISTIALLLKERSISSRASPSAAKEGEPETLNLDEDDDETADLHEIKENGELYRPMSNGSTAESRRAFVVKGGRPAAGTLVVCPTSVLRQWADELHNKVTSKADLSVLVYHGSNRTKDPYELAKYDVVLTTYSIVSMEVPKQPLADKDTDDDEKGNLDADVDRPMGLSSNKKRKYPPSSGKKCSKNKKGRDSYLLESISRPLAKVGWFRVVLDEAQSIKNHKTQVARACWGLRAKRRWCLSGTPIQNAVDDLYSYFRFLRYEPYSSYQEFCSKIKVPINKHSSKGYKKLQAVLKTIMLRRTKGTLLDGQPIITLPPKSVELKKVEFSAEERDFYTKLEADSRAQFEEYAAAGTVKQNYVNILLMLLRLRQACDHPLLVKGCDSSSVWKSSVESAMKFPQEKQSCLLSCLEDSLALCGICNDPPEDAVVTACSHVFCNQCILEHLSGEDNQCPVTNCKDPLCVSSVFSRHTLTSSLSCGDSCSNGSELVETTEYCSEDSSKIRAALEVMQSLLPKPASENDISSEGAPQNCLNSQEKGNNSSSGGGGEKAIVFSQWTKMLDLVEASLKSSSIHYRRLDGTMSVVARDKAVKDFNILPEVTVIIMSLKAASLGLNMVAACHVVLLDLWWNPTTEDQAIDRAHHIGQTRPVKVVRLTVKDTVEDRILALQQKKRNGCICIW